jgi:branched-chain amino acid transport system permease protein
MSDGWIFLQLLIDGLSRGAMYGLMGMGMALIFGIVGIINLAHGELFMLGCFVMYYMVVALGLPPAVGIVAASLCLFAGGILIERGLIGPLRQRLGGAWLVDGYVLTIGVMIILQNLALIAFGPREHGVASLWPGRHFVGELAISNEKLVIMVVAGLFFAGLATFLRRTFLGRAIRATAQNPAAAQVLGIDVRRIYTIAFGIGSGLAGAVGGLLLTTYPAYPTVGGEILLKAFIVVIIGGLGNIRGAMLAGLLLGVLEAFSISVASGGWQNTVSALLVIGVLVLRPNGLFSSQTTRP